MFRIHVLSEGRDRLHKADRVLGIMSVSFIMQRLSISGLERIQASREDQRAR